MFSPFLGTVDFHLAGLPLGAKSAEECSLEQLPEPGREVKLENLFERKRVKGWWPMYSEEEGERTLSVSVMLDLIIILFSSFFPSLILSLCLSFLSLFLLLSLSCSISLSLQGKVELEMEIVSLEEEQIRPAGKARDEPNLNPVLMEPK